MIINQSVKSMKGKIIYRLWYDEFLRDDSSTEEYDEECDEFEHLDQLMSYMKQEHLNRVAEESGDYTNIEIYSIVFYSKEEVSNIRVSVGNSINGFITTKINNQDVENRLLRNLSKIKEITDNALEGYPTAY